MEQAPFFADVAEGPDGGQAVWTKASDGVRIRVGWWPAKGTPKGTLLIFPGRTEYIEKYGRDAQVLCDAGYAVLAVDWRGQGIADRLIDDPRIGHVKEFPDYQKDVAAVMEVAKAANLPRPYHMLGHSMGGCIGLRAAMEGLDVKSVIFSAPMWGIRLNIFMRPIAVSLSTISVALGKDSAMAPGMSAEAYPLANDFAENKLTADRDFYDYMARQVTTHEGLKLGGPSMRWLNLALSETKQLAARPAPNYPCLTLLGEAEAIVDPGRILTRMKSWPGGDLMMLPDARHEVLMEVPATREAIFKRLLPFMDQHGAA
ncbi:alpha/beta hydrolase [Pseudooceanicola sp. MF1-13]|uniref:alpha/beta hydrolase n=1 Tax=Pseudooceanicola sp. MF1-13 TaxID=3379095 RepID=UPI0038916894